MMITLLEKYETQRKLLKVRLYLVASLLIVSTRIGGGDQYDSNDAYNIDKLRGNTFTEVKLMTVTAIMVIPRWRTWNQVRKFFVD
jgi:hypothetical protein